MSSLAHAHSSPSALLSTLRSLPTHLRANLPTTRPRWSTLLVILLLLTNLKSLPLAWHVRLFYRFFAGLYSSSDVRRALSSLSLTNTKHNASSPSSDDTGQSAAEAENKKREIHPLFTSISMTTHAPLLEIDYNLHKSNSTYFSDLDESRCALMAKILGPALLSRRSSQDEGARVRSDRSLEAQGIKGRVAVMLGSVHCSFHREIRAYEAYEVRSRVVGWDRKWLVVGSWLVKPAGRGKGEVLLASALSKYVVKKGRFTVSPERCLRVAGWLPEKDDDGQGLQESAVLVPEGSELVTEVVGTPAGGSGSVGSGGDGVAEGTEGGVLEKAVEKLEGVQSVEAELEAKIAEAAEGPAEEAGAWDWARIERERLRGLKIAEGWLALDVALKEEFAREG